MVPDALGGRRPPGRGEERGQAIGDGRAVTGSQVAAEGIGFDQGTRRPTGQLAARAVATVVTPGEPLMEARATTVTFAPRSPAEPDLVVPGIGGDGGGVGTGHLE